MIINIMRENNTELVYSILFQMIKSVLLLLHMVHRRKNCMLL